MFVRISLVVTMQPFQLLLQKMQFTNRMHVRFAQYCDFMYFYLESLGG